MNPVEFLKQRRKAELLLAERVLVELIQARDRREREEARQFEQVRRGMLDGE